MDRFRNWLMSVIAGEKFVYWIKDDAQKGIDGLNVLGVGAAICLVDAVRNAGADLAKFTLADFEITVQRTGDGSKGD